MSELLKSFIKRNFTGFTFFFRILRYRMFLALAVSTGVGVLDGFGLAMFLPLLQIVAGETEATGEGMGNLDFLVNWFQAMGLTMDLRTILAILVVFFLTKGLMTYLGNVYKVRIRQYFLRTMRLRLLNDFNRIKFKSFIQWDPGRIQNAMTTETERITMAFYQYFRSLNYVVLVMVYMVFAFTVDPKFAGLVVVGGILSNFIFRYFYKLSKKASRNLSRGNSTFHGLINQYIGNFKYLKATGRNLFYGKKLEETILEIETQNTKLGVYGAVLGAMREPIMIVVVAVVILLQTEVIGSPLGPIMVSLIFFYRALVSLNALQLSWNNFIRFSGSLENVAAFAGELKEHRGKEKGKIVYEGIDQGLTLEGVSFDFGPTPVLKDLHLTIAKNESIALVGESGSGKTTLVNILAGLLKPTSGAYRINGALMKDMAIHTFQSRVGFIAQEPVIFNASIYDNVTFWAPMNETNLSRFNKATQQAALEIFLGDLPEKENTMLGANGINLSGGQRQRIAIARELFRDIDILILDEATAALDSETEQHIQSSIDRLKGQYTLITVAHRLATIRNADRVALLDKGRLVNVLPYQDLILEEEKFQKMVELQSI